MEKRGSRYLRYALFNATKFVCNWDPSFAAHLAKKRSEGKHYNVAISHAAKKLVRLIFALMKSGKPYCPASLLLFSSEPELLLPAVPKQPAKRTLDKPKHSNATLLSARAECSAVCCPLLRPRSLTSSA